LITKPAIPLPDKTPSRKWLKNKILVKAKRKYYPPLTDNRFQYSLTFQQSQNNCRFKVLSYDLFGDSVLKSMKSRTDKSIIMHRHSTMAENPLPDCPSYVMTEVYRRKVLYRELVSYNADLVCLQCVNAKEYDRWYLDLSKLGYSGLFKAHNPTSSQQGEDIEAAIDYSDTSKFGSAILYKRARFNRIKDWIVKLTNDGSTQAFLNKLAQDRIINDQRKNECMDYMRSNIVVGMIMELEFKDSTEMIDYMKQYTVRGTEGVVYPYSDLKLLVACVKVEIPNSRDPDLTKLLSLLQAHVVTERLEAIINEQEYEKNKVKTSVIIGGNFAQDRNSLVYRFLSSRRTPRQQHSESANFFRVAIDEEEKEKESPKVTPLQPLTRRAAVDVGTEVTITIPVATDVEDALDVEEEPTEEDMKLLAHCSHSLQQFDSAYGSTTGKELVYNMSDVDKSPNLTQDFLFFQPSEMQVRCIAKPAPDRTFPNIHFVSEHIALFVEMEMTLMMKQLEYDDENNEKNEDVSEELDNEIMDEDEDPFSD
jgi:hypothetical protein